MTLNYKDNTILSNQKLTQTVFAGSPFLILLKSSLKEGLQVTQ